MRSPGSYADPGRHRLTPRQTEVARLAAEGMMSKEIARRLGISIRTVKAHLTHVYRTLGVNNRTEMSAHLLRRGPRRSTRNDTPY